MKKVLQLVACYILAFSQVYAQKDNSSKSLPDSIKLLNEFSNKTCNCLDSINIKLYKSNEEFQKAIITCIDKSASTYQLSLQLLNAEKAQSNGAKNVGLNFNTDKNSDGYRSAYSSIQHWLIDSCKALRRVASVENIPTKKSGTSSPEAGEQYNKGIQLLMKDNFADAIYYFKQAVTIDPAFSFAWDNLGISYRKTNQLDKALDAYKKSLQIDPNGTAPLHNIPVVYQALKDYDKAIESYDNLLIKFPNDPETYFGKSNIYTYYKKDLETGLDLMCKAFNLYRKTNSPYLADAENALKYIYVEMKKAGKEDKFNQIVKDNNINIK